MSDTDKQLMDKLVAGFNERLDEKQSRKCKLDSEISRLNREYKDAREALASIRSSIEELQRMSNHWYDEYCRARYISDEAEEYAYRKYQEAKVLLDMARAGKRTAERKLHSISLSLSSSEEEFDALSKEIDGLLNLPEEKKAETYYNWLLDDIRAAKSQEDCAKLAELTTKFRAISGYKNCVALADDCEQFIKEQHYRQLVEEKRNAKTAEEFDALATKFSDMGDYKDCVALADDCKKRIQEIEAQNRVKFESLKSTHKWSELILGLLTVVLTGFAVYKVYGSSLRYDFNHPPEIILFIAIIAVISGLCLGLVLWSEYGFGKCLGCIAIAFTVFLAVGIFTSRYWGWGFLFLMPIIIWMFNSMNDKKGWIAIGLCVAAVAVLYIIIALLCYLNYTLAAGLLTCLIFAIVKGLVKNNPYKKISSTTSTGDKVSILQGAIKNFYLWFAPLCVVSALLLWLIMSININY